MGGIDQRKQKLNLKPILLFELSGVCVRLAISIHVLIQIISRRRHHQHGGDYRGLCTNRSLEKNNSIDTSVESMLKKVTRMISFSSSN